MLALGALYFGNFGGGQTNKKSMNNTVYGQTIPNGPSGEANLTFFDDSQGGTGIKFDAYPLMWNGKAVYPVAVHQKDFKDCVYKILEVSVNGKTVYGHVVDMCDKDHASCKNAFKNNKNFLVDMHEKGWSAVGATTGILACTYKVVGILSPNDMPQSALNPYIFCACKDAVCDLENATWKPPGKC